MIWQVFSRHLLEIFFLFTNGSWFIRPFEPVEFWWNLFCEIIVLNLRFRMLVFFLRLFNIWPLLYALFENETKRILVHRIKNYQMWWGCDSIRIFVEAVAHIGQLMVQIHIMLRIYFSAISLVVSKRYFYYIRVHKKWKYKILDFA